MSFRSSSTSRRKPREAARRHQQEAKTARGGGENEEEKKVEVKLWARAIRRPPSAEKVSRFIIFFNLGIYRTKMIFEVRFKIFSQIFHLDITR